MTAAAVQKLSQYFSQYEPQSYKKGQVILFGGEATRNILYLATGQVRQYDITSRGDEIVVNVLHTPALFPVHAALTKMPNRYFFEALTDVMIYAAPPDKIVQFLKTDPDVSFGLLRLLYDGHDDLLERMAHLMNGNARSKVLYELFCYARSSAFRKTLTGVEFLNESELASRSGLSRETVSREVHKLKQLGVVDVSRKGIVIKDIAQLEAKLKQLN